MNRRATEGARAAETRQRLMDGTVETIRRHGISGVSARTIASTAGVNQALIFYHFGSVDELLGSACLAATAHRVEQFRDRLAAVTSLRELLAVGRELHDEERALGNVTVLAQMLAGAQADPKLATATAGALGLWTGEIERVVGRLLAASPFRDLLDAAGLSRAVCAGFVGLELLEATDARGAADALATLEQLGALVDVAESLPPVAQHALRASLKSRTRR